MPQPKRYASNAQKQAAYRQRIEQAKQGLFDTDYLPPLPKVEGMPGTKRWRRAAQLVKLMLTAILQEMDDYYNGRSDDWRDSDQGQEFEERKRAVEEALEAASDLEDNR